MSERPQTLSKSATKDVPEPQSADSGIAQPTSWKARLEALVSEYGPIAIVVYLGIMVSVWAGFAAAITAGFDVGGGAGGVGVWGAIGAAYIPTKLSQPVRIAVTFAITPIAARVWRRARGAPSSQ